MCVCDYFNGIQERGGLLGETEIPCGASNNGLETMATRIVVRVANDWRLVFVCNAHKTKTNRLVD